MICERVVWIDVARGIGILLVMLGHLIPISYFKVWIYSFHIPLFFFISGLVFRYDAKVSFHDFIVKKAKGLLVPYISFAIILLITDQLYQILHIAKPSPVWWQVLMVIFQFRYWTIWFLVCLFVVNILAFVIIRYCNNNKYLISGLLSLFFIIYSFYVSFPLPWCFDNGCVMLSLFFLGVFMRDSQKLKNLINNPFLILCNLFLSVFLCFLSYHLSGKMVDVFYRDYGFVLFSLPSSFFGIMFIVAISKMIKLRIFRYVGENSLIYFGLHQTCIYPLVSLFIVKLGIGDSDFKLFIIYIVSIMLLTLINIIIAKSKFRFILGKF